MPEFRYSAMQRDGKFREGSLTANTDHQVRQLLRERGLLPIQISSSPMAFLSHLKYASTLDSRALAEFCRQMAMVLQAGVTLTRGLELMRTQIPNRMMRQEADRMYREVQTGRSLSEVMSAADSRVPPLLARMVATGEASGRLDEILTRMAEFYEQEHTTQKKIQGAMVYPAILLFVSLGLIFFVFKFLIPQIQNLLKGTGAELPAVTKGMLAFSALAQEYFLLIGVLIILVILSLKSLSSSSRGRLYRDRLYASFPALGMVVQGVATARFARTACIVFSSGLPLLQGLELIKQNVNNSLAEQAIDYAVEGVQRGESLADNLEKANFFDSLATQMVRIGEETGRMDEVMEHMAAHYDREAQNRVAYLLTLIEPVMIFVMGGIVGFVVVSSMLPLFDLIGSLQRQ